MGMLAHNKSSKVISLGHGHGKGFGLEEGHTAQGQDGDEQRDLHVLPGDQPCPEHGHATWVFRGLGPLVWQVVSTPGAGLAPAKAG